MEQLLTDFFAQTWLLGAFLVLSQVAFYSLGFRFASKHIQRGGKPPDGLSIISGGILGLTAFILALTLSLATTRMQERRDDGQKEANAIRTAWEKAHAVSEESGTAIARMLETYIELRRSSILLDEGDAGIEEIGGQILDLQNAISSKVAAIAASRSDDIVASLMDSVSDVFDETTAERLAVSYSMPVQINGLMIVLVCVGIGIVGHQVGMTERAHPILSLLLICIWAYIVLLIMDIGDPRTGSFRTSTSAYDMTILRFNSAKGE